MKDLVSLITPHAHALGSYRVGVDSAEILTASRSSVQRISTR
jgi:hypothetical protein